VATGGFGAFDVVVLIALIGCTAFVLAWAMSPALRARIERPKYIFQKRLQQGHDE
jgi:hypothetical protein